jgi:hypothetical protein
MLAATAANEQRSLTTFSRTGRTTPDTGSNAGQPLDYDLRIRTPAHWPDTFHWSTDQKVGGSSPSERAQVRAPFRVREGLFC